MNNSIRFYIGVMQKMSMGLLSTFLFFACAKKEEVSPSGCNKSPNSIISYKQDVLPIVQSNCLSCHNDINHFGGIVLENYQQLSASGKSGELYNSIFIQASGFPLMPKGGKLKDCEISLIQAWINQGSLNN